MVNNCQVLLLATSEKKKLEPLTLTMPTPMIPLANKPVMVYSIEGLARQGFKQVFVSLYHMANQIEAYFGSGERWGIKLDYVLQHRPWGTAGALKWAAGNLTDTIIVLPADALVEVDISTALTSHFKKNAQATMVVSPRKMSEDSPIFLDHEGFITNLVESPNHQTVCYDTGVYLFDADLLQYIPPRSEFDIQSQLIPAILAAGMRVNTYQTDGYWNPLRTFQDYQSAQREYLVAGQNEGSETDNRPTLKHPFVLSTRIAEGVWVGRNNIIHPNTMIAPPVIIGDHCRIGKEVEIGPNAVIGSNVIIDEGASILESTIIDNTYVGKLVHVENRLVNKNMIIHLVTGESLEITDAFLLDAIQQANLNKGFNRLVNLLISSVLLLAFLPLFVLIALFTWLTTGHIFQTIHFARNSTTTRDSLKLIRFYTRKPNDQPTWMGKWLEALEFNRLPELINVLRGDVSMVGVKPLSREELNQVQEEWQQKRFECPTGITGIWYINTGRDSSLDEVLVADAYYAATRNWHTDAKLMWQTIATWFKRNVLKEIPANQS